MRTTSEILGGKLSAEEMQAERLNNLGAYLLRCDITPAGYQRLANICLAGATDALLLGDDDSFSRFMNLYSAYSIEPAPPVDTAPIEAEALSALLES